MLVKSLTQSLSMGSTHGSHFCVMICDLHRCFSWCPFCSSYNSPVSAGNMSSRMDSGIWLTSHGYQQQQQPGSLSVTFPETCAC